MFCLFLLLKGDSKKVAPLITVCLVDEMDYLLSRNLEVLYNFYSWPQHAQSRFVLVGIANTMDLPEMMSIRLVYGCNVCLYIVYIYLVGVYNIYMHRTFVYITLVFLYILDIQYCYSL